MKKTIYLVAISFITILCVGWSITRDYAFIWSDDGWYGKYHSDYIVLDKFDTIAIDAQVMEVIIKRNTADQYAVEYSWNKKYEPQYSVSNGTLSIVQSGKKSRFISKPQCSIVIMVPYNAELKLVDVRLDIADIKSSGVYAKEYNISAALGDIKLSDTDFEKAAINANLGDIKIKDCAFTDLRIDANLGDIDVKSSRDIAGYSFDLRTDLGEIRINGKNYSRGYKCGYEGDGKDGTVNINGNLGDISIKY